MLSKRDIQKELGKGINIYPLYTENIKENSINLSISSNCWTEDDGDVYWYGDENFSLSKNENVKKNFTLKKGDSSIVNVGTKNDEKNYLLLLPHTTTAIETEEVIGVGDNIGGALHSKVGIAGKGIGHIGTMLGPGFCGHLLVSLHNITNNVIALEVGSTFVSISFDYLETEVERTSSTVSGHVDKFSDLGLNINESTRDYITKDWKNNIDEIREKMILSDEYKQYKTHIKREKWKDFQRYFSRKNIIACACVIILFISLLGLATYIDNTTGNNTWVNRFWNVGCSGIVCSLLVSFFKFLKN
ncbi:MAG: deoxycytidine deaminase [Acetatifactor sp.]|nr:deoxycytidine deaminase [Acetatifactor sp.]